MARKRVGTIVVPPGAFITKHEKLAADFLASNCGYAVTFLVPERRKNVKTSDIVMLNLKWEIKCPKGKSSRTIENNLRSALEQSPNIIMDLRRIDGRIPTRKLVHEIQRRFNDAKAIKHIIVITKDERRLDFKR